MASRFQRPLAALALSASMAGMLLAVVPALPALTAGPVDVVAREVSVSIDRIQVVPLPIAASDIALHWAGNPDAKVKIAFADASGTFGEDALVDRDEVGENLDTGETYGDVIWAAGSRLVRVTSDRQIGRLTVVAFQADGPAHQVISGGPVVTAAVGQPAVITRAGWGANESLRFDAGGHEMWPPSYAPVQQFFVHHTDGRNNDPNPAATVRSIYYYHAITQGWGDIGYNFLIDASGRIYEGRHARAYAPGEIPTSEDLAGNGARGAQAKGFNEGSIGIAMLGTFDSQLPTVAARTSLEKLIAWIAERHSLNPTASHLYTNPVQGTSKWLPTIAGHRDVNQTDCPGATLYAYLPTIRKDVAARIAATTGPIVDHTAPTVRSLRSMATTPTGGKSIAFGLIFSEPVTGLTMADFEVSGTSPGWAVTGLSGRGATYTVTAASAAPTDGTVIVTLSPGAVADLGGHSGPATDAAVTTSYAVDTTPPTASLYVTRGASTTTGRTYMVTITFSEPVAAITAAALTIGGTSNAASHWTVDVLVGSGAHYGFSIHHDNPPNGTLTLAVHAGATSDPAGNPNPASAVATLYVDRTAPKVSAPIVRLRPAVTLGSSVPATITWTGSDVGGSGVRTYDLARSLDGRAYQTIFTGLVSPTASVSLTPGHTYRFEARAHDRAGNLSGWAASATVRASVVEQTSTSIVYHGAWTSSSSSLYSGGSVRYATASGASASLTTSTRSLSFVTSIASSRGSVRIYVDGTLRTTISLAGSTAYRRVAYATGWATLGTHTIRIVVVGSAGHPRVDLDAFSILR
ncbi:MAG TPA: N-acetylmuramoyl-L-alanine amidase [Candidatus Limnocylindrales bacterium]|nr:N-acetylmuramoyl-L-alanine amidase [Candidatus Limnocylindrales bacterium]